LKIAEGLTSGDEAIAGSGSGPVAARITTLLEPQRRLDKVSCEAIT